MRRVVIARGELFFFLRVMMMKCVQQQQQQHHHVCYFALDVCATGTSLAKLCALLRLVASIALEGRQISAPVFMAGWVVGMDEKEGQVGTRFTLLRLAFQQQTVAGRK